MTSTRVRAWLAVPAMTALYCIPVLASVRPVDEWDIWWHLRIGEWIVEHGRLPDRDPFTVHGGQTPWVAYSWAFEVLAHALYRWLGLAGIVLLRTALAVAVIAACHRLVQRREPRFVVSTGLAMVVAIALIPLYNERPWLFTILFTTCTLEVVLDLRAGVRRAGFWLLPVLYVAWASLHIQFVYGFVILGLACVAPFFDGALGAPVTDDARTLATRDWHRLVALTTACLLATLLSRAPLRRGARVRHADAPVPPVPGALGARFPIHGRLDHAGARVLDDLVSRARESDLLLRAPLGGD